MEQEPRLDIKYACEVTGQLTVVSQGMLADTPADVIRCPLHPEDDHSAVMVGIVTTNEMNIDVTNA